MEWFGKKEPPGMVAMPALDWMYTGVARCLRELEVPPGSQVFVGSGSTAVVEKRNTLVAKFLEARPKLAWLLFLDADTLFPPGTVRHLLKWEKDVVSGVYVYKDQRYDYRPVADAGRDVPRNEMRGLIEVQSVGAGCLMIRRRVVEELVARPWFEANLEDVGEDVAFCRKVREAGGKVWLDAEFVVGHIGPFAFTPDMGYAQQIIKGVNRARAEGRSQVTIDTSV